MSLGQGAVMLESGAEDDQALRQADWVGCQAAAIFTLRSAQ